jgi:hypothetical protein
MTLDIALDSVSHTITAAASTSSAAAAESTAAAPCASLEASMKDADETFTDSMWDDAMEEMTAKHAAEKREWATETEKVGRERCTRLLWLDSSRFVGGIGISV